MQRIPTGVQIFVDDPIVATRGQYGTFIAQDQGGTYALPCEQGHSPTGLIRVGNGSAAVPAGQWSLSKLSDQVLNVEQLNKGETSQYNQQDQRRRDVNQ